MDDKPWTTVAREQLGWLSYLTWPYRAYQWTTNYLQRGPAATPQPKRPAAQPTKIKVVRWHGFEGSGGLVAFLWFGGLLLPMFTWMWWKEQHFHPTHIWTVAFYIFLGCTLFLIGVAYYIVKRLRTVDQDRRRRVDHPLGCTDAAPRLEARSEA